MSDKQQARELLLAAAEYIRKHGFHPDWPSINERGCFLHAIDRASAPRTSLGTYDIAEDSVRSVIGADPNYVSDLIAHGWDETATNDAIAACLIAADLVSP